MVLRVPEGAEDGVKRELEELDAIVRGRVREMVAVLKGKREVRNGGEKRANRLDRLKEELVGWVEEFDGVMERAEKAEKERRNSRT